MKIIRFALILFLLCSFAYAQQKLDIGVPIDWSNPQTDGLVGWWYFQEGGGNVVYDISGNGSHGTLTNMAFPATATSGWNPGKFGLAPRFEVNDDYIQLGRPERLTNLHYNDFTIMAWVQGNMDVLFGTIFSSYDTDPVPDPGIMFRAVGAGDGTIVLVGDAGFATTQCYSQGALLAFKRGEWAHVAGVFDSSSKRYDLFVNGVPSILSVDQQGVGAASDDTGIDKLIGARTAGAGQADHWDGLIDDLRIYNRGLSQQEIQDIMNGPPPFLEPLLFEYKASLSTAAQVIIINSN